MNAAIAAIAAALLVAVAAVAGAPRPPRRGVAPGRERRIGRRHRATPSTEAWVALLDALAADVRAGASLRAAWASTAAWPEAPAVALRPQTFPADGAAHEAGSPADEAVVHQAVRAAAELGGPVAATLDAGAALLRERLAARAEAQAHAAQARLSARVLTAVPLAFAGWSALTSASFRAALLSPAGAVCAVAGGGLNLAGWAWMRRLVRAAGSAA
ncbi:MAG: type II secretion system F family protein [Acidimicrobiaceae bacterium]|nr:type II secretion system F family protein [Ilumatobacter sp.]MCB9380864.1 type II secretion system F family protein [Acidimicrobiaceae bacterium]MCO5329857.1 hypothetical protein [Ilumatobacteraceae bacterium]